MLLAVAPGGAQGAAPTGVAPAAGGRGFLRAAESAQAVVLGTVHAPSKLDLHGWTADLAVERVLAGRAAPGGALRVAWEELATARPPRLSDADRVLLALVALPSGSLWMQRFPKRDALAIGAGGQAFLRSPAPGTVDLLARYLALTPPAREQAEGVTLLTALVQDGAPVLTDEALERLDEVPGLAGRLERDAAANLGRVMEDRSRPAATRTRVAELIGRRHLLALRPSLERGTRSGSGIEAGAWDALAELDGGLPPETVRALVDRPDPALRRVAIERAGRALPEERLAALLRHDPAPEVRQAAVKALLATFGDGALETVTPALFDPDPAVRTDAAQGLGALGPRAVPTLRSLVEGREARDAAGPIAALALAGPEGRVALREIADRSPDPAVRRLAEIALGKLSEH